MAGSFQSLAQFGGCARIVLAPESRTPAAFDSFGPAQTACQIAPLKAVADDQKPVISGRQLFLQIHQQPDVLLRLQASGGRARALYPGAPAAARTPAEEAATSLVAALAAEKGTTGEAIVLGWLMRHPAGIAPVIGTANPDRILACAGAPEAAAAMTRAEWYGLWVAARGSNIP